MGTTDEKIGIFLKKNPDSAVTGTQWLGSWAWPQFLILVKPRTS